MARPKLGDTATQRLHIKMTAAELLKIEEWQHANGIASKSEAIRRLCHDALSEFRLPFTVFCRLASGEGAVWISTVHATCANEAASIGVQECSDDWNVSLEDIHILGIAKGDVEIMEWND